MAEIIQNEGGGKKKGKRRPKKHSTHIDMTPMVDLFCLLLTFFMLTSAFSKPKVMEIGLPPKEQDPNVIPPRIPDERVVNIILDENDKVYWYNGMIDPKKPIPTLSETNFSADGLRKVFLNRNKAFFLKVDDFNKQVLSGAIDIPRDSIKSEIRKMKREDNSGPVVLIKATEKAKYGSVVNVIDELSITSISRYSIIELSKPEMKLLDDFKKNLVSE
jgi:biopolymer transport protein ExbD